MLTLWRRFGVLSALMFWQGGFVFYAAVVVPIGQQVLYSDLEQAMITRRVTYWLNVSGAIALSILASDLVGRRMARTACSTARWFAWLGMVVLLVALFVLHSWLDQAIDSEAHQLLVRRAVFRPRHRLYLWASTVQWGLGVVFGWLTIMRWREEDLMRVDNGKQGAKKSPAVEPLGVAQSPEVPAAGL